MAAFCHDVIFLGCTSPLGQHSDAVFSICSARATFNECDNWSSWLAADMRGAWVWAVGCRVLIPAAQRFKSIYRELIAMYFSENERPSPFKHLISKGHMDPTSNPQTTLGKRRQGLNITCGPMVHDDGRDLRLEQVPKQCLHSVYIS